ncbi:MAG: hypothetical protein Q8R60_15410 [Mycobacteriales bacterium]|nr:hypothetical protein [Mycobacteriales bacterium]
MPDGDVAAWFHEYLSAFAACGRGERSPSSVLSYYDTPLLMSTDAALESLTGPDEVLAMVEQQVEAMRAAGYDHSEVLDAQTKIVNAGTAVHYSRFSRRRADGSELSKLAVTYLISRHPTGRRISALLIHSQVE